MLADRAVGQADIQVRLLPIRGADVAADWAAHQLHELKRASATFGYQLDPAVVEFRERLIEWQRHPSRTRRDFRNDLDRWRAQRDEPEQAVVAAQDSWVAEQHHERYPATPLPDTPADTVETRRRPRRRPRMRTPTAARSRRATRPSPPTEAGRRQSRHHSSNIETGTARLCRVWRKRASIRSATSGSISSPSRNSSMSA